METARRMAAIRPAGETVTPIWDTIAVRITAIGANQPAMENQKEGPGSHWGPLSF
jgi:hypothetical protein